MSLIPLSRIFGANDVVVASLEGKSILRAAIADVAREFKQVTYLPSYEYVTMQGLGAFEDDLRHVSRDVVQRIIAGFAAAYIRE